MPTTYKINGQRYTASELKRYLATALLRLEAETGKPAKITGKVDLRKLTGIMKRADEVR